mgnify:CR=1 FL=1
MIKLKYFAWIREITKNNEEYISSIKINDLDKLRDFIVSKYPELKKHLDKDILRFAVNTEYVAGNINLESEDEVAVFPPVSGG